MQATIPSEIIRTNLSHIIMTLKALGLGNIVAFELMEFSGFDTLHSMEWNRFTCWVT